MSGWIWRWSYLHFLLKNSTASVGSCWAWGWRRHAQLPEVSKGISPSLKSWIDFHWKAESRWRQGHFLIWQWKPWKKLPLDLGAAVTYWCSTSFHAISPWTLKGQVRGNQMTSYVNSSFTGAPPNSLFLTQLSGDNKNTHTHTITHNWGKVIGPLFFLGLQITIIVIIE